MQLVCDYYKDIDAIHNTKDLRIEFGTRAKSISLNVPASGVATEDKSWTITPLSHPQVLYMIIIMCEIYHIVNLVLYYIADNEGRCGPLQERHKYPIMSADSQVP